MVAFQLLSELGERAIRSDALDDFGIWPSSIMDHIVHISDRISDFPLGTAIGKGDADGTGPSHNVNVERVQRSFENTQPLS
mmetsp:Transcript_80839/g.216749  ORF Transcript_80839/g.216749 Transcript_80839/m.216749 type:complete len:81 (-) Transcript_80839:864-1106(-)